MLTNQDINVLIFQEYYEWHTTYTYRCKNK